MARTPDPGDGPGGRPGQGGRALWRDLRHLDSYLLLLAVLVILYFALMIIPQDRWSRLLAAPLVAAALLLALRTSGVRPATMLVASVAATIGLVLVVVQSLFQQRALVGETYLLLGLLLGATPLVVLRRVLGHQTVTVETIAGAVCVYVLLGMVFAFAYLGIGHIATSSFADLVGPDLPLSTAGYLYLSYTSLTTVGFGDIVAVSRLPRALVVMEALLGQIFLVTTVARLVALFSAQGPRRPRRER